jgi:ATP-dependent RNA helicase RhlE
MTPEVEAAVAATPFATLGIIPTLLRAVVEEGYTEPSPIQREVIPVVLKGGDVLACAQTGTGKTAAFVLPILQRMQDTQVEGEPRKLRTLILAPTRELAVQIGERVAAYGRHVGVRHTVILGGVSQHRQEMALRHQPDLLVATPGRLLDLMKQGFVKLDGVTHFVLDEADRMLDMGFVHDVRRIAAALPRQRQTLLFSATMAPAIEQLAQSMTVTPSRVSIAPTVTTAERVEQSVMFVSKTQKRALLERVLRDGNVARCIVFTRTKHGASRLSDQLAAGGIESTAIHGNKSQNARERALDAFRRGSMRVLVATDVAARGIDVEGISHVINFDLPNVAESYVHRIGRTGRAGAAGRAISFCDPEERGLLADIERFIRKRLPVDGVEPPLPGQPPQMAERPAPQALAPGQGHGPRRFRGARFR